VVYYSRHSHYSVAKAVRLTGAQSVEVPVDAYGEINYAKLGAAISKNPGKPAIIMANIGTTMTGAIDDVHLIRAGLEAMGIEKYYIHCDGALHGLILPYTQSKKRFNLTDVHSVSISGHKFIGSPIPCGVFLTRKEIIDQQKNYIEYIHIHDCTITGSRNAITPLMLWSVLIGKGYADWSQEVKTCLENTQYAVETLVNHGIRAWANADSNIVVFPKPRNEMVHRWQLACYEGMGHVVVMPHVDKAMVDRFIDEMVE
jgi:histidine decarboxylase